MTTQVTSRRKRILVFAYYSFYDPVFQSAVLPYFEKMYPQEEFDFVLLTFEQKKYIPSQKESIQIENKLKEKNIIWHSTVWHSGRFKLLKKAFSFGWGMALSIFLMIKYRINGVYAAGVLSGVYAYYLSVFFRVPLIVHSYEPHSDYMTEGNVWPKNYWGAKLLKYYERIMGMKADFILTGTQNMINHLTALGSKAKLHRVPSCVDCALFKPSLEERQMIRQELQVSDDTVVITYLGKFGDIYMDEEIIDFFAYVLKSATFKVKFMIITPDDHEKIKTYIRNRNLNESLFHIITLTKNFVPQYLNASDFGYVPVKQTPSRKFCTPIKDGEYWACGVPLLIYKGISDDYIIAEEKQIGIVMDDNSVGSHDKTIKTMEQWISSGRITTVRQDCVDFACQDRNLSNYMELYKSIFRQC